MTSATHDVFDMQAAPLRIGRVTLRVNDLDRVAGFYREVLGLRPLREAAGLVELGLDGAPLLVLVEERSAPRWSPRQAGLFHTAFLLPSRADLGAWLRFAAGRGVAIAGASDHLVSDAVYLADPEGNGIEIYADRAPSTWPRTAEGVAMATRRMDVEAVLAEAVAPWSGMPPGSVIGHVHLQVGELDRAVAFYAAVPGLGITARYPGGVFFGAGGYHHQLAANVWNSAGAAPTVQPLTGLAEVELLLLLPALSGQHGGQLLTDPWNTALRLRPAPAAQPGGGAPPP